MTHRSATSVHTLDHAARDSGEQHPAPLPQSIRPRSLRMEDARLELKRRLGSAFSAKRRQLGLSQSDVAADLDIDKTTVGRFEAAGCKEGLSVAVVASAAHSRASRPLGLECIREQAEPYGAVVTEVIVQHGDHHIARLAAVTVESSDVPRALATALADGEFSADELRAIVKEAREAAASAMEVEAWASAQLRKAGA